jgi:hypothetical protein
MGLYLKDAWWNDLNELRSRTDKLYERIGRDIWQVTAEKMIELRGWKVKEPEVIPVIQELGAYYVPKKMFPGPMFVFPETDASGHLTRAQTKPLHDLFGEGKYHALGVNRKEFLGPIWLGNTDPTLEQILQLKSAVLVEGPFDLIATRILSPHFPILSPLTKTIGSHHIAYLKILGVKSLYILFDNEESEAGFISKQIISRDSGFRVDALGECPGGDPSAALQSFSTKGVFRKLLKTLGENND